MTFRMTRGRGTAAVGLLMVVLAAGACGIKDDLLEATDPDIIDPSAVQSPAGATAVRNGALSRLRVATADGESSWLFGGLLVDEYASSSTFVQNDETDQRTIQLNNSTVTSTLRMLYRVRTDVNQAIALLRQWKPKPDADMAEMYFARGFAEMQLASDFCNGIPLSDGTGALPVFGKPLSVAEVFGVAVASFDSALALVGDTTTASTKAANLLIHRATRIAKARALLGLGISNAAAAAALVTDIPTSFRYDVTASLNGGNNTLWDQPISQNRYIVGDSVQKNDRSIKVPNAIPFYSSGDRRVPAHFKLASNGKDTVKAQDGGTFVLEADSLFGQTSSVALTAGIDARLIEAEAALKAGDVVGMLGFLNALRASPQQLTAASPTATGSHPGWTTPVMAALVDPGTQRGREDLLFREKAFWTFSRGQRLGDLRRLIRDYGRKPDGSDTGGYPIGPHYKGGVFGPDLNLPVTTAEQIGNPNFSTCTDRKA